MKEKEFENIVIGFLVSFAVALGLYWIYRQRREVSPAPLMVARDRSRLPKATKAPAKAVADKAVPAKAAPADDLERISGIGPVTARRFNEAGVTTYAQLAALTPDKLQEISETGRWNPADWIEEAGKLANQD